jgi:hypothetical protein
MNVSVCYTDEYARFRSNPGRQVLSQTVQGESDSIMYKGILDNKNARG